MQEDGRLAGVSASMAPFFWEKERGAVEEDEKEIRHLKAEEGWCKRGV